MRISKIYSRVQFKRTFTLLELFFCLAILTIVGSLLIIKAQPMIAQYRFQSSVSRLVSELEWSYKVAMNARADIDLKISQRGNALFCKRSTDEPFTFGGGNRVFKIDHIPCFAFNGKEQETFEITFTRFGFILPEGTLTLYPSSKKEACFTILLPPEESSQITAVFP